MGLALKSEMGKTPKVCGVSAGNNLLPNMQNKFETYRKSINIALSNILYYSFYKI